MFLILLCKSLLPFIFSASALAAWKKFVEKEGKYISNDGRPLHQKLVDGQGLLEKALTEDKDANTIELLKLLNAVGTQMLPHIQDEKVRQIHSVVVDDVSKLINDAAANKLGKDDIHNFIRKTYKGVSALWRNNMCMIIPVLFSSINYYQIKSKLLCEWKWKRHFCVLFSNSGNSGWSQQNQFIDAL